MELSVIVVDWRRPEITERCLVALHAAVPEGVGVEVVLVRNEASDDAAPWWRERFPGVVVVSSPTNLGFAGGVALGLAAASSGIVVLVNNDAVPAPGFLAAGLRTLQRSGPDVAAVTGRLVLEGRFRPARAEDDADDVLVGLRGERWARADEGVELLNSTGVVLTRTGNGHDRDWLAPASRSAASLGDPFGFSGGAVFLRRGPLEAVGGFDPSLFMYYEDLDVAWRLRLADFRTVHEPAAVVVHRHAGSSASGGVFVRQQSTLNRLAVVARNGSSTFLVRVVARTVARLVRDLLSAREGRHLPLAAWSCLARSAPAAVVRARRLRRADGVPGRRRRELERTLPR